MHLYCYICLVLTLKKSILNPICICWIMQLPLNLLKSSMFLGFNIPWSSLVKKGVRNLSHISLKTIDKFLSFSLNTICTEVSMVLLDCYISLVITLKKSILNKICICWIMQPPLILLKSCMFSGFNLPWSSLVKKDRNLPHISLKNNDAFLSFWLNRKSAAVSMVLLYCYICLLLNSPL